MQSKFIEKPWGNEVWLELNASYCFKKLTVRAGHRLSLQYHQYKKETLILISGSAVFTIDKIDKTFNAGDFITIDPGTIHRIEAITDCILFEASTPEVDDVVRVQDDYQRN
jgi:mannose-6-phosphate isomerase-like protein (cupin superfamily)